MLRVLAALLALAAARPAWGDAKEVTLSAHPAYAVAYVDDRTAHGGGLAIDVGVGVSDALSVHATGFLSWHAAGATAMAQAGVLSGFAAMAGIKYTLDVIRLVPSFDLQLGAVGLRGGAAFGDAPGVLRPVTAFALGVGFALDYLVSRRLAVGVELRYQAPLTDLERFPMYLYAGPRVVLHFNN